MKKRLCVMTVAVAVLIGGCATAPPADGPADDFPEWFLDPSTVYPQQRYMAAVGSGRDRRDAEQQALAALSQAFEVEIEVDETTRERYRELMTDSGTMTTSEIDLTQVRDVRSAQTLLNVQFGEAFMDQNNRVHIVAYLDRMETGRLYVDLINRNEAQIDGYVSEASGSGDPLRRYAFLSAAEAVAANNDVLKDQLRIISPPMSATASAGSSRSEIVSRRTDAAQSLPVAIEVTGDTEDRILPILSRAVAAERFPISDSDAVLSVEGAFEIEGIELNPDFESVAWAFSATFGRADGTTLLTYDDQGRSSGITVERAVALAYEDMAVSVEQGFA
ncbi:MAG: LPP20 family lipoprotein, partial [bacterium]